MERKEYGYIEGGVLYSRWLEERREVITDEEGVTRVKVITVEEQAAELSYEWKPVDEINGSLLDCEDPSYVVTLQPYDAGDHISYHYVKRFDVKHVRDEIQTLKDALTATDYQVTKCYEASLTGQHLPYDIDALHAERQAERDKINELEQLLNDFPKNVIIL